MKQQNVGEGRLYRFEPVISGKGRERKLPYLPGSLLTSICLFRLCQGTYFELRLTADLHLSLFYYHSQFNGSRHVVSHLSPSSDSSWNGSNNQSQYSIADAVKTWQHAFSKQRCSADVASNYCKYQFNDRPKNFPSKRNNNKKSTHTRRGTGSFCWYPLWRNTSRMSVEWFRSKSLPSGRKQQSFLYPSFAVTYKKKKRSFIVGS
jgi:hypothetical protein